MLSSYTVLLFGMMGLLSFVDSLITHTMWNHCNNNDILMKCNVVNYNRSNSKWGWVLTLLHIRDEFVLACVIAWVLLVTEMYKKETGYISILCDLTGSLWTNISNITLGLTEYLSFIWLLILVSLYIQNFSKVFNISPLFIVCIMSMMFSMGPIDCLFSKRCRANLDLFSSF